MTRWLCKINWYKEQCKITIPKALVVDFKIKGHSHLVLDDAEKGFIKIRRFDYRGDETGPGKDARHGFNRRTVWKDQA